MEHLSLSQAMMLMAGPLRTNSYIELYATLAASRPCSPAAPSPMNASASASAATSCMAATTMPSQQKCVMALPTMMCGDFSSLDFLALDPISSTTTSVPDASPSLDLDAILANPMCSGADGSSSDGEAFTTANALPLPLPLPLPSPSPLASPSTAFGLSLLACAAPARSLSSLLSFSSPFPSPSLSLALPSPSLPTTTTTTIADFASPLFSSHSDEFEFFQMADSMTLDRMDMLPTMPFASTTTTTAAAAAADTTSDLFGFKLAPAVAAAAAAAVAAEPSTHANTNCTDAPTPADGTNTNSGRKRKPKVPVPEDVKQTAKYQERRRKNTLAAARNRAMKRAEAERAKMELPALDHRNEDLRSQCAALRAELQRLVGLVHQRAASL